jgi:hypothetical protein
MDARATQCPYDCCTSLTANHAPALPITCQRNIQIGLAVVAILAVARSSKPNVGERRALRGDSRNNLTFVLKENVGGSLYTGAVQGAKYFDLQPLSQAAQSGVGTDSLLGNDSKHLLLIASTISAFCPINPNQSVSDAVQILTE